MKSTLNFDAHSDSEHDDHAGLVGLLCIRGRHNQRFYKKLDVLRLESLKQDQLKVFFRDTIDSSAYEYATKNPQTVRDIEEKTKCSECKKLVKPSGIMCSVCDKVTCNTCDKKFQESQDALEYSGPCMCPDGDRKRISEVTDMKKLRFFDKVKLKCPYNPRTCNEKFSYWQIFLRRGDNRVNQREFTAAHEHLTTCDQ